MNVQNREAVEFKGTGRGLILYIHKELPLETIFDAISVKIKSSPTFFIGGVLTDIDSNYISPYQKRLIIEYLDESYDITYTGVDEFHFNQLMKQKEYKGASALFKAVRTLYIMDLEEGEVIDYNGSAVIMTTTPKDSVIKVSCDAIILGSVENESKIIAGGNITVMGELRGMAYAGAYGNDSACIIARQINAQKIGIFDCESEYVISKRLTSMSNPEIAYIDENKNISVSQKKEVLYKYSPESIKDTSYGAFDITEQGVMMEKNESFGDFAYEVKYTSDKAFKISKEELEESENAKSEDNIEETEQRKESGIKKRIRKEITTIKDNRETDREKEKVDNITKKGMRFVDRLRDLLIEEEVEDEEDRL